MQCSIAPTTGGWHPHGHIFGAMGTIIRFILFRVLGGRLAMALAAIGFLRSRRRSASTLNTTVGRRR